MPSNLPAAQRADLEQRRLEHGTVYWMQLSDADVADLVQGIVSEQVQSLARMLAETDEAMLARTAAARSRPGRSRR